MRRYARITKASKNTYWYAGKVGDVFPVHDMYAGNYRVRTSESFNLRYVDVEDCELIYGYAEPREIGSVSTVDAFERGYKRGFEDAKTEVRREYVGN